MYPAKIFQFRIIDILYDVKWDRTGTQNLGLIHFYFFFRHRVFSTSRRGFTIQGKLNGGFRTHKQDYFERFFWNPIPFSRRDFRIIEYRKYVQIFRFPVIAGWYAHFFYKLLMPFTSGKYFSFFCSEQFRFAGCLKKWWKNKLFVGFFSLFCHWISLPN
jgi:hypothetical protein